MRFTLPLDRANKPLPPGRDGAIVPRVGRVNRTAVHIIARLKPSGLVPLLRRVVVRLAERLPIVFVPEQRLVAAMGLDVVNNCSRHHLA